MKQYQILLFDADNTLFDFTRAEYLAFRETTAKMGLPFSEAYYARYSEINDGLWKRLERKEITLEFLKTERFRLLLAADGEAPDTLARAETMRDVYIASLASQTCLIDGADEVCHALSKDYRLFLVTNGISKIQRSRLSKSALADCFEDIFVSEELGVAKPAEEYFDRVFAKIGADKKDVSLVIGDSLSSDCDGAIRYGIDICRYNPAQKPADGRKLTYEIQKLTDLLPLLKGVQS